MRYALADFHPFGEAWDRWCDHGEPELPVRRVVDAITGREALVPACLIPFPHLPRSPSGRLTASDTCGLAAHPTHRGAVLRGALEILERHDFYPAFLHQRPGRLVDASRIGDPDADPVARLVADLARIAVRTWLLVYGSDLSGEDLAIPIVHAFLFDAVTGAMSRGSGSGGSLGAAARRALLEALQIRAQYGLSARLAPAYEEWRSRVVVESVLAYLERQDLHVALAASPLDEEALFDVVRRGLARRRHPLLVADLPCPIVGWSAIRALVPGLTTNQHPSRSAGGVRLAGRTFTHGIPT